MRWESIGELEAEGRREGAERKRTCDEGSWRTSKVDEVSKATKIEVQYKKDSLMIVTPARLMSSV